MKTCLFSLCYLDGLDKNDERRFLRYEKYLNYYLDLQEIIGFDMIELYDNGSNIENVEWLDYKYRPECVNLITEHKHLPRGPSEDYPACWRALNYVKTLTKKYDKIISIDSDGFILSKRLADYVRNCNSGWESFWCPRYDFPEAAFHILNKDSFGLLFAEDDWMKRNGEMMENVLPFTNINRDFELDRYGEYKDKQEITWDACFQTPTKMEMRFVR